MEVLIVDDVAVMRIIIKNILVKHCAIPENKIYEAESGRDAIRKFKQLRVGYVLLDINMPDIDGVAVIKELVKLDPGVHTIMCTSSKDKRILLQCMRAGAKDYILKPPVPQRVARALGIEILQNEQPENEQSKTKIDDEDIIIPKGSGGPRRI